MKNAENEHVDESEDAEHEIYLVVVENLAHHIGQKGRKPVRGIRRRYIEEQQKCCSFGDMEIHCALLSAKNVFGFRIATGFCR